MENKNKINLYTALCFLGAFILWTVLVCLVDIQAIGPRDSSVGLATLNGFVHSLTGANMTLYEITDWLGLVPVAIMFGFAILGLCQLIKRKSFKKVDYNIYVLGAYYVVVFLAYFFFEYVVINYRPVLIDGYLEASYPSSTTMLVLTMIPTTIMQLNERLKNEKMKKTLTVALSVFMIFMVIVRLVSGVHWLSDIVGGVFLSISFVKAYEFFAMLK